MTGTSTEADRWLRCFRPDAGKVRLVCFPHAGGSASYFFPWTRSSALAAEVWAVQYPGRQDRRAEPCVDSIPELAARIHGALESWPDGPTAFFGHSMGAVLAFEVARRVEAGGGRLARLFASGWRAPSRHREEHIHQGGDDRILAEMRRIGGTDERFLQDPELIRLVLPTVRADYRAVETYVYADGPRLRCGITAMVGDADPKATVEEAAAWGEHCTEGFDLRVFPGDHFYLDVCRPGVIDTISSTLAVH